MGVLIGKWWQSIAVPVSYVVWLAFMAFVVLAAAMIAQALAGPSGEFRLLMFAIFFALLLTAVCIHELGHAIFGVLAGFRIHLICVGPLGYRPIARKFEYVFRAQSGDFGGYVFATPRNPEMATIRNWMVLSAGGPLANFLVAILCVALAGVSTSPASDILGGIGMASAIVGLASLVPVWNFRGQEHARTDGAALLDYSFSKALSPTELRIGILYGQYYDNIPPQEWDAAPVDALEREPVQSGYEDARDFLLTVRFMALGEKARAKDVLAQSGGVKQGKYPELAIEYAFLLSLVDNEFQRAEAILAGMPNELRFSFNFLRAKAVTLAKSGDYDGAR